MSKNLDTVSNERAETSEDNAEVDLAALAETDPELAQVIADLNEAERRFDSSKGYIVGGPDTEERKELYRLPRDLDGSNIREIVEATIQKTLTDLGTTIMTLKRKKAELERARKESPPASKFDREVEGIKGPFHQWRSETTPLAA